ncbi:MAG: cytochrome c peroxidase [Geobacteraceae bacterium]
MPKVFSGRSRFLMRIFASIVACLMFVQAGIARAAIVPPVGLLPLNQIAVPEPPNLYQFVKNKALATILGKALFWDMQVGSDGMTACASCHFHAGTDNRMKNTVNPGTNDGDTFFDAQGPVQGPNETVLPTAFPFHQRQEPVEFQASPVVRDANDIVGSQGVRLQQFVGIVPGSRFDQGSVIPDPVFNVAGSNVRQVTGRNTPSVINAVFNFTNFWDGRASAFFNGVNPFGPQDTTAGVWFNVNGTLVKQPISLEFASLASQATAPPLNEVEMSFRGRTFPDIGRKMLSLTPLGGQFVHPEDSSLGLFSRATQQTDGSLSGLAGLDISYEQLIKAAFHDKFWNSNQLTPGGYTQMEANFSLFWGLAIQLYEATLVSDDTPFDRFLGGDQTALTEQQEDGFNIFFGGVGRCDLCHGGSELTMASVVSSGFVNNASHALIELMNVASGKQIIYDNGFNNTAVRKTNEDVARGGDSPFANLLTPGENLPLSFSAMAELQAQRLLPFSAPILPGNVPPDFPIANDGAFKVPSLRNVELTAPFMHNGGMLTLEEVVDFYVRGGDFPNDNKADLDLNIAEIPSMQTDLTTHAALVAFMKSMTDERVRNKEAPFDHPELLIPNGDSVNDTDVIRLPAVGMLGLSALTPLTVALSANVASPQVAGTPVTITATKDGGSGTYEYEFWLHNGSSWSKVRHYALSNSWNWDTTTAVPGGVYTIQVNIRNSGLSVPYEAYNSVVYSLIVSPSTGAVLVPDKASPQLATTPGGVTFTAAGQGGTGSYEYEFWLHNGTSWSKVQNMSASNSWNWDTAAVSPGVYTIQVNLRSAGSTASYEAYKTVVYTLTSASSATGATLEPDKASPQPVTTPGGVTLTAAGQGGSGSYEYEFWLHNGTSWSKVQNMSASNSWNWDTAAVSPGVYSIQVNLRSAGSTASYEAYKTVAYTLTSVSSATGATLEPDKASPQLVTTPGGVIFTAAGQGGSGSYEYEFWLHNGISWSKVQDISVDDTWSWDTALAPPGTYTIQVNLRSAGSFALYEAYQAAVFVLQ